MKEEGFQRKKSEFKYYNMWSSHNQFIKIVEDVWQKQIKGCKMFQIVKKMKMLKKDMKNLHSQHFSKIMEEVDNLRENLQKAQEKLQMNSLNLDA